MTITTVENQAMQDEIAKLQAENASIIFKVGTVSAVGSILGLIYAKNQNVGNWGKVGYFFAGGTLAAFPLKLYYTDKQTQNTARIEQLQRQWVSQQ